LLKLFEISNEAFRLLPFISSGLFLNSGSYGKIETVKLMQIRVQGVVQGVGFRPFIYRLAHRYGLGGWVRNTSGNVQIEVEGEEEALNGFLSGLRTEVPPMARIEEITVVSLPPQGYTSFEIRKSLAEEGKYQLVSPDIATCRDCQDELFTPSDRRYH